MERIHKSGEGWSYTIDPTPAPAYWLIRLQGVLPMSMDQTYYDDTREVYKALIKRGWGEIPLIAHYGKLDHDNWSMSRFSKVHSGLFKPTHTIYAIRHPDRSMLENMLAQFSKLVYRNLTYVDSVEEALDKLGIKPEKAAEKAADGDDQVPAS